MYSTLSWLLHRLPLPDERKLVIKSIVYRHFGWLLRRSPNYRIWLRQQEQLARVPNAPPAVEPSAAQWKALGFRRETASRAKDLPGAPYVVIPVYLGRAETLSSIYHVLAADPSTEVVVLDDCSPDENLVSKLRSLAAQHLIALEKNEKNLGFALTANRGMAIHPDRDVVLLNSDTEVYGDWLTRLNRVAYSDSSIGTVTPLSNNAEICSYPHWLQDNPMQIECGYERLDDLARRTNDGRFVEAPTGVGFCMYIRRECVADVGPFDERFAAGYGEENDFCLRAAEAGWKHAIAGEVFVRHLGSVSFGRKARRRRARALAFLLERFPDYTERIAAYVESDPVRPLRQRLDVARLVEAHQELSRPQETILFVVHAWGGGVERHVAEMESALRKDGIRTVLLRPAEGGGLSLESNLEARSPLPNTPSLHALALRGDRSNLVSALKQLAVSHIHIHSIGGFGELPVRDLAQLSQDLQCAYDITLHDFAPICPRLHLSLPSGAYCGGPERATCERCISTHGTPFGRVSREMWHREWEAALGTARRVFCPSRDTANRVRHHFPEARYAIRPHHESLLEPLGHRKPETPNAGVRIAIPGAIGPQKGLDVVIDCARDASKRSLPLSFHVVGYTADDAAAQRAGVEISGEFDPRDADRALAESGCSLVLIPSLSPETFSFVLSSAFRTGLLPVVFDLGALAERVRDAGWGEILPMKMITDATAINDRLLELGLDPELPEAPNAPAPIYSSILADYYEHFTV